MNTASFFDTVESIFHDWNYGHPKVLWGLVRALRPKVVLEVGTYRGYAAAYMARALQENNSGHLYCVDNFSLTDHVGRYGDPVKHWRDNLMKCGVVDFATLICGDSGSVPLPRSVDLAYIDGWHSYLQAKQDFELCAQRGAQCICLDDTLNCIGPRRVVAELDPNQWTAATIPNDNGLTICSRAVNRRVTFSQELPGPGTDITAYTDQQLREHLAQASALNGVVYGDPSQSAYK